MIHILNEKIRRVENELFKDPHTVSYPVLFIVAPPRSGTTLLYQMMASAFSVFYPTNLIARAYGFPAVFLTLFSDMGLFSNSSNFESELGNTKGIFEPHEWGWFWDMVLEGKSGLIAEEIGKIQSVFPAPMLFKNINFVYNLKRIRQELGDKAVFVYLDRDIAANALSILNSMKKKGDYIGSRHVSPSFRKLDNAEEAAVLHVLYDRAVIKQYRETDDAGIDIKYEDVCIKPEACLKLIRDAFNERTGANIEFRHFMPEILIRAGSNVIPDGIRHYTKKYEHMSLDEIRQRLIG